MSVLIGLALLADKSLLILPQDLAGVVLQWLKSSLFERGVLPLRQGPIGVHFLVPPDHCAVLEAARDGCEAEWATVLSAQG